MCISMHMSHVPYIIMIIYRGKVPRRRMCVRSCRRPHRRATRVPTAVPRRGDVGQVWRSDGDVSEERRGGGVRRDATDPLERLVAYQRSGVALVRRVVTGPQLVRAGDVYPRRGVGVDVTEVAVTCSGQRRCNAETSRERVRDRQRRRRRRRQSTNPCPQTSDPSLAQPLCCTRSSTFQTSRRCNRPARAGTCRSCSARRGRCS